MGENGTVKQALREAQELHEETCRILADQRDAAQARLAEVQFAATGAIERAGKAEARVRELEAENEQQRTMMARAFTWEFDADGLTLTVTGLDGGQRTWTGVVDAQTRADAALGRDLRCLMEWMDGGHGHVEVWGADYVHVYKDSSDDDGTGYATLAGAADAVRGWKWGQEKAEPAPVACLRTLAEVAALAQQAADELAALTGAEPAPEITQEAERIHLRPLTGDAPPLRCHEVTVTNKPEPEPAPSPEDAARASDGAYHLKPIEAGPAYNVPVATLKPAPPTVLGCPVKVADLPDGVSAAMQDEAGHVAVVVNATTPDAPEPAPASTPCDIYREGNVCPGECEWCDAPTPQDSATARIEAAGASIYEGHAVRVDGEDGQSMTISGVPTPTGLAELVAFAEAHRVTQEPPGGAPEAPAEG